MLQRSIVFIFFISIFSCQSSLDRTYIPGRLMEDTKQMLMDEVVSEHEMFLINYAIIRQRDYFNYKVEGTKFSEILALARGFEQDGLGVKYEFESTGKEQFFKTKTMNDGIGHVRISNTSQLKKVLNFHCEFENTSDKDIVLLSTSFQVYGPFKDHLTTVGYDINTVINAHEKKRINFYADGINIRRNAIYDGDSRISNTRIDDILLLAEIKNGGCSITRSTKNYVNIRFKDEVVQPSNTLYYSEDLDTKNWLDGKGDKITMKLGPAHFISDEVKGLAD